MKLRDLEINKLYTLLDLDGTEKKVILKEVRPTLFGKFYTLYFVEDDEYMEFPPVVENEMDFK